MEMETNSKFSRETREQHKRERRVQNSLGSLLAGIGKAATNETNYGGNASMAPVSSSETEPSQSYYNNDYSDVASSYGTTSVTSTWSTKAEPNMSFGNDTTTITGVPLTENEPMNTHSSDYSSMTNAPMNTDSGGSSSMTNAPKRFDQATREQHKKERRMQNSLGSLLLGIGKGDVTVNPSSSNSNGAESYKTHDSDTNTTTITKSTGLKGVPAGYSGYEEEQEWDWEDYKYTKEDELDEEWLKQEHAKLDEMFGEGIVTVKYTDHDTLGYQCLLCLCTMNALKPLESHCGGMKHLKKKDLHEKSKAAGEAVTISRSDTLPVPKFKEDQRGPSLGRKLEQRGPSLGRGPYPQEGRDWRSPYPQEGSYWRSSYPLDAREPYSRAPQPTAPYSRDYRHSSSGAGPIDPYSRSERDFLEREDRYRLIDRSDPFEDRYRLRAGRADVPPPPPKLSPPPPPRTLSPSMALPPPGRAPLELPDVSVPLAAGPASLLLKKLAQCIIKNENDAELASSVINLLIRSLKSHYQKSGERNVADLMEQAEIKLGTAKALRSVKKATPPPPPKLDAVSLALENLRRVNEASLAPST